MRSAGLGLAIWAVVSVVGQLFAAEALAQSYPNKPIRVVTGSPAGSGNDTAARLVAQELARMWDQPVAVENRPGASQGVAAITVAGSPPDGYTLAFITSSILASALQTDSSFKLERDLLPVNWVATGPLLVVVNSALPVHDLKELIELAHSKPEKLHYGSAGIGTTGHLLGELFNQMAGVRVGHVPYKGGYNAGIAAASGEVEVAFAAFSVMPLVESGKLRAIAVSGKTRVPQYPSIPTMDETLPGCEKVDWYAMFAPAGTPSEIVERLHEEVAKVANTSTVKGPLAKLGIIVEPTIGTEAFAAAIHAQLDQYVTLANKIGLKPGE